MLPSLLLAVAMILFAPWWPDELPPQLSPESRLPVALVVESSEGVMQGDFDVDHASRQLVEGVAARLKSRGVAVRGEGSGILLIGPGRSNGQEPARGQGSGASLPPQGKLLTLSVGFNSGTTPYASGSETRFGGDGDAAWRLAQQLQRHLVRGLWDVLAYDSYDRGVVEETGVDAAKGRPVGLPAGDPWVASYPLFATNPSERALLQSPEALDLLSSALANALYDYLDPVLPTPDRSPRLGWRSSAPWQPVSPRVLSQSEHGGRLALTFDGGASSAPTPAILKALRDAGIHATMFLTAEFVEKNPGLVVQMAKDGHEFGNHSSTHPDMTKVSSETMVAELDRLEADVVALTGKSTRPWFRPPYGAYNDRVVRTAAELGYYSVLWAADSADWRDDIAPATVQRRLLTYAAPGAVLIEHLGSPQSAQVLPDVLTQLKDRGYSFGTLSELFGQNAP